MSICPYLYLARGNDNMENVESFYGIGTEKPIKGYVIGMFSLVLFQFKS